ncbi:MAG TPA: hypothetical protein VF841_15790 [Anaeromyxobacter sp.]
MRVITGLVAALVASGASGPRADYRAVTVTNGGAITGRTLFRKPLPANAVERFPVSGKWPGCGTGFREVVHVDVKDGALRGCFVLIDEIHEGKPWPKTTAPALLNQKGCRFLPPLQIVQNGTPITVRNSDPDVLHNVNVKENIDLSSDRTVSKMLFNFAQPVPGDLKKVLKATDSPFLTVGCDIHNWMVAYMLAPPHPYAAIVDKLGNFRIDDVPPGTYSLTAWHPRLGKRKATVTVTPGGVAKVEFDFGA